MRGMNASGYENAPATILLATNCACCGRPLVDALSVETGMGPVCREKHGFNAADAEVDFLAVAVALAAALPEALYVATVKGCASAREAANRLVHRAAVAQEGPDFTACAQGIAALGFTTLATTLVKRAKGVRVERTEAGELGVFLPGYNPLFVAKAKAIGGRAKKLSAKVWRWDFPAAKRAALWSVLKASMPSGTPVSGEKGVTVLA